jgi:hypothetical protein
MLNHRETPEGAPSGDDPGAAAGSSKPLQGSTANGQRPKCPAIRRAVEADDRDETAPIEYCAVCGEPLQMCCLLCCLEPTSEGLVMSRRQPVHQSHDDESLKLGLRDEDQVRYEEVRAKRLRKEWESFANEEKWP